MQLNWRKN